MYLSLEWAIHNIYELKKKSSFVQDYQFLVRDLTQYILEGIWIGDGAGGITL